MHFSGNRCSFLFFFFVFAARSCLQLLRRDAEVANEQLFISKQGGSLLWWEGGGGGRGEQDERHCHDGDVNIPSLTESHKSLWSIYGPIYPSRYKVWSGYIFYRKDIKLWTNDIRLRLLSSVLSGYSEGTQGRRQMKRKRKRRRTRWRRRWIDLFSYQP